LLKSSQGNFLFKKIVEIITKDGFLKIVK